MPPEMRTKTTIMMDVVGSSSPGLAKITFVINEIMEMTNKITVNGLIIDS